MVAKAFVLIGMLALSNIALSAEQARLSPEANARLGALRAQKAKDGYAKLFAPQPPRASVPAAMPHRCTATTIDAEPYFNRKGTQSKDTRKYTMRSVPAPCCR